MAAGNEEVAAEIGHGHVFDSEAVDSVDTEEGLIAWVPPRIDLRQPIGDAADRKLDPGGRVHPRESDHACPCSHGGEESLRDCIC